MLNIEIGIITSRKVKKKTSENNSNRVCQIVKIEKPVIQGLMFWLTDAKLIAADSEAGGLGVLGLHAEQNSLPKDDVEKAERLRTEIRKVKELTSKPFGVNLFHSGGNPDIQIQFLLKHYSNKKYRLLLFIMMLLKQPKI